MIVKLFLTGCLTLTLHSWWTQEVQVFGVDVSKMKTIQSKLRITINKSEYRENSLDISQARLPKSFIAKSQINDKAVNNSIYQLEIFARKKNSGHWIYYDVKEINQEFIDIYDTNYLDLDDVFDTDINSQVFGLLLGKGIGAELEFSKKIKESLSQFKKTKPKDLEYGYRLIGKDSIRLLSLKSKVTELLEQERQNVTPAPRLDVEACVSIPPEESVSQEYASWIDAIRSDYELSACSLCMMASDGSALMRGNQCVRGNSGVVVFPFKSDCERIGYTMRIHGVEAVSLTAFDPELVAGLASSTICRSLSQTLVNGTFESLTDSKTLSRAIRTGPSGELFDRGDGSRQALWSMMCASIKRLGDDFTVSWVQGHPERVKENSTE
jgi:hypothetical protein